MPADPLEAMADLSYLAELEGLVECIISIKAEHKARRFNRAVRRLMTKADTLDMSA